MVVSDVALGELDALKRCAARPQRVRTLRDALSAQSMAKG